MNLALLLARAAFHCSASDIRALAASVQDDSFYYVLPAFRFWERGYWTFDGEHPTFGVQPGFAWFLTALAAFFDDRFAFFRAALWTNYLFFAGAAAGIAAFLYRLLRPCGTFQAGLAAALGAHGFLLSGTLLHGYTTLKENALYALLLILSLCLVLHARLHPSRRALLACGFATGLAVSCRLTPSTLLVAGVSLAFAAGGPRIGRAGRGSGGRAADRAGGPRIGRALALAGGMAAAVLPWALHALATYGRVLPTSGTLKTQSFVVALQHGTLDEHLPRLLAAVGPYLSDVLRYSLGRPSALFLPQGMPESNAYSTLFPLLLLGLPLVFLRRHALRACPGALLVPAVLAAALAGTALNPILLGIDRMHEVRSYYTWYLADLPLLLCVLAPLAACLCVRGAGGAPDGQRRTSQAGALMASLLVLVGTTTFLRIRPLGELSLRADSWSTQMVAIAERANELLDPTARIGSYNAGVVGFLSEATVVNLDGLANDDILEARSRGATILEYVRENRIDHLVDPLRPSGWFGNAFDRVSIVAAVPFRLEVPPAERSYYDGYFLLRVVDERFPDFEPPVEGAGVRVVPWLPADPLGAAGEAVRCFRFEPRAGPATATFHTVRAFRELRFRAGSEHTNPPAPAPMLSLYAEDGRLLHRSTPQGAAAVDVPCLGVDRIVAEVTASVAPGSPVPVTWLTDLVFEWETPLPHGGAPVQTYGEGCNTHAGPGAPLPRLHVHRDESSGEFRIVVTDGPPDASGSLGIGSAPSSGSLAGGCRALVELTMETTFLPLLTDEHGRWEERVSAPPDGSGAFSYAQAVFRDPLDPQQIFATTNGVRVWVGSGATGPR